MAEPSDGMLYGRRRRTQAATEREAAGSNLWTQEFDSRTVVRLERIVDAYIDDTTAMPGLTRCKRRIQ